MTDALKSKLGLSDSVLAWALHAPIDISGFINVELSELDRYDWLIIFSNDLKSLLRNIDEAVYKLNKSGQLWLAWPKKSSKLASDLNDTVVRQIGLNKGLVDIKVLSINETYSALKFVYRKIDRND